MSTASAPAADARRTAYLLLTAVAVAVAAAKVAGAENLFEPSRYKAPTTVGYGLEKDRKWPEARPDPTPMYSSNDRSRWATVRALVDEGTYSIGRRVFPDATDEKTYTDEGIKTDKAYDSLDIVLVPLGHDATGPQSRSFYSSKPPLFATLVAGEYWLLKEAFGWSIVADRWPVMLTILLTVNVLPFAVYLVLLSRLIEKAGRTDFGRLLAFAAACFGTFLTTFSGTLNNHLPAAFCVLFSAYPLLQAMAEGRDMGVSGYLASGFFAGFAATFELPAVAFLAGVGVPLLLARPRPSILYFMPAALLPILALFACNYASLGQLMPAYGEFGGPWYNFAGSHWAKWGTPKARGIDFNSESTPVYTFHLLFGHHGWFSLTPVWLIALVGLLLGAMKSGRDVRKLFGGKKGLVWTPSLFAAMSLAVSTVVFLFFLTRTQSYNYGGNTSGPRWLFWLTPLWLLAVPPAADRLAKSGAGRAFAAALLGFAALSAFYPAPNPWRSPWILQVLEFYGWLHY